MCEERNKLIERLWRVGRLHFHYFFLMLTVAVGTTIADRPPHRSVRARLRIRLLPWMCGGEAFMRIGMQNAGFRNPALEDRDQPIPDAPGRVDCDELRRAATSL